MSKKSSVNFKVKPTNFVNLSKITGLILLSLFTFYFIYNYLTTGSFDLRPSASGALEGDGGVASCGALLTQLDCNKYSERGCSWVVGPSTVVPKTSQIERDCTTSNCTTGAHGCKFTETTKKTGEQRVPVYECEQKGLTQAKCKQLGLDWIQVDTKVVPIYTTTKSCDGSWTDTVTTNVTVAGVGSCTGTLKPLPGVVTTPAPNTNGGSKPPGNAIPLPIPKPNTGTCSAGTSRCLSDGKTLRVCTGNNISNDKICANGCKDNKCIESSVWGCTPGEVKLFKCRLPKTSREVYGVRSARCVGLLSGGYWKYEGVCQENTTRQKCRVENNGKYFTWENPFTKEKSTVNGAWCDDVKVDKLNCSDGKSYKLCQPVTEADNWCSNVGYFPEDAPCIDDSKLYGVNGRYNYSQYPEVRCMKDLDCYLETDIHATKCDAPKNQKTATAGRCYTDTKEESCSKIQDKKRCETSTFSYYNQPVSCVWHPDGYCTIAEYLP